jgi:16S rRNA (uracil1498-N3)-methyltransferase
VHRFHLPAARNDDTLLTLTGGEAHHALRVLRLRRGERVTVLNGAGGEFLCEVREVDHRSVQLAVIQTTLTPPLPCRLTLAQSVAKGKTMDLIVQKATELGAHRISPIISERTVAQIDEEDAAAKVEKWRAVAIEAIKQCGSPWLPRIDPPCPLGKLLQSGESHDLSFVASLREDARHPRDYFQAFRREHRREPRSIRVWIGPEGDFTPAELDAMLSGGALPITLGPLVLRSETAAICALAVVNYETSSPPSSPVAP